METQNRDAKEGLAGESNPHISSLAAFTDFLRDFWLRVLAVSAAVIAPCLWHPRIEAGDLSSHLYNAWLAHLIESGQAPGLYLARQWNNVLFDLVLNRLGDIAGLRITEKIVVSVTVLIFFWGAFALVCAMARCIPWFLLPCLAIFAYGYTFEMGFMNYYVSIGLAFFALAILKTGRPWERVVVVVLAPLIWIAHPLGLILFLGAGTYMLLAERVPPSHSVHLFIETILVLLAAHFYIKSHFDSVAWKAGARIVEDGTDQLLLFGPRYALPAHLLQVAFVSFLLVDAVRRRHSQRWWLPHVVPMQLYGIALAAATLLPSGIHVPQFPGTEALLTERLTSVSAIFACCLLGAVKPLKWHLAAFVGISAIFFFFLYNDTSTLNRMEDQTERYVRMLPPGQRVIATIWPFEGSRILIHHMVDRACIGHCFSYDNYEPSTGQFRVRARFGNSIVLADGESSGAAQGGTYIVQSRDLPLFQIYQCDLNMTKLCLRELVVGEMNGRIGAHGTWEPQ